MSSLLSFANTFLNRVLKLEPFQVVEVKIEDYIHHEIEAREDSLILHSCCGNQNQINFEIVLHSENQSRFAFSLYRSSDPEESQIYYLRLKDKLPILVTKFPFLLSVSYLQELCKYIHDNPSQNLAHICANFGYVDYFKTTTNELKEFINVQDDHGRTPLLIAVEKQRLNIIQAIIALNDLDINYNLSDENLNNVLHYAAQTTHQIISTLCQAIKTKYSKNMLIQLINTRNRTNFTPLYLACFNDKPSCVKELLKNGAYVNGASINDQSTSSSSTTSGQQDNENEQDNNRFLDKLNDKEMKNGGTPLHWCKSAEVIEILVEMNCNLNARNFHGDTALHHMVERGDLNCIISLLSHGADVNAMGANGNTALHVAVKTNNISIVQSLIVFGADVDLLNSSNDSPRHLAATSISSPNKDTILYVLHSVCAKRCTIKRPTCNDGCAPELSFNGVPPENIFARNIPLFDKILLENVIRNRIQNNLSSPSNGVDEQKKSKKKIKILSMDGGGIRGLILIQILCYLESITDKRTKELFDWISGCSTGGILALLLSCGYSAIECRRIYFQLKDKIFVGSRPYCTDTLENFIKQYLGSEKKLCEISHPRLFIPALLADRFPCNVQFYRNYRSSDQMLHIPFGENGQMEIDSTEEYLWKVARATGAAPTYFAQFENYLDGGLISNNPTMDLLTEIQYQNRANEIINNHDQIFDIDLVVSLGTGIIPERPLERLSFGPLFSFSGISSMGTNLAKAWSLIKVLVEQATQANGRVVDRAQAWCSMIQVPFFRINPSISEEIQMDESDNVKLINMMWETMAYIYLNAYDMSGLISFLIEQPQQQKPVQQQQPS